MNTKNLEGQGGNDKYKGNNKREAKTYPLEIVIIKHELIKHGV